VLGGVIAQATNLGVPFLMRVGVLVAMFFVAARLMRDLGFTPEPSHRPLRDMRVLFDQSIEYGLDNPPVRWVMLAAPFSAGVGIYAFYAMQPYLLELWGNSKAYSVAGLAAAIIAGAQIVGGYLAPLFRRLFRKRTTALILATSMSFAALAALGLTNSFYVALVLMTVWAMVFAAELPIRQAYLNDMIPSRQRATVLSFDSLMGSSGGVVIQPVLGKVADAYSYSTSLVVGSLFELAALPFLVKSRRERPAADIATTMKAEPAAAPPT
jgi:MFS family permease